MRRLRAISVAAACLLAAPAARTAAFNPNNPAASGYSVSFYDNFTTVNPAWWANDWWYDTPTACQKAYLPGTVSGAASGLTMHIQSLETVPACAGGPQIYSAAHLDSSGYFAQSLGYYEASIQTPPQGGTLTAFWLLPASGKWPPELDIEEIRGDVPNLAYLTNHFSTKNKQIQYTYTAPAALSATFHTYGALITNSTITWYIDGVRYGQTKRQAGEAAKLFMVLSLYTGACGDGWAGCPSQTTGWSADAHVAWVRAWLAPH